MCGIAGIYQSTTPPTPDLLRKMAKTLHHRGPDDHGTFCDGPIGIAHTRLSIIDLSQSGHQPMSSEDNQIHLVYNGEIYNFPALRKELQQAGITFRGRSDTEVLLEAYCYWGTDAFAKLNGMFAFAIWDSRNQTLLLVRDRLGIKPLYYTHTPNQLIFASEIKAILATGLVKSQANMQGLSEYLWYGNTLGEQSFYQDILKLTPGTYLTLQRGTLQQHRYWQAPRTANTQPPSFKTACIQVRDALSAAVKRQLVSDVPIGLFLSGGIDSSAVTAFAQQHSATPIQTFAAAFDFDAGVNELANAKRVADHFGTHHHELMIHGKSLPETIEKLAYHHDEPFGDAANIPLYMMCQELDDKTKVVLQGDGGDELFGGYRRYVVLQYYFLWRFLQRLGHRALKICPQSGRVHQLSRIFDIIKQRDIADTMALLLTVETDACRPESILSSDMQAQLAPHHPFARYHDVVHAQDTRDLVQKMLYTDTQILLPNTFLEKVDKSTMASSIEVRVPFLDHDLVDLVMPLPGSYKVHGRQKKWLLRQALWGVVPDFVLDAPKTGFAVPYGNWLRYVLGDYFLGVVQDPAVRQAGIFNEAVLKQRFDAYQKGQKDHGYVLWKALQLALWFRREQSGNL